MSAKDYLKSHEDKYTLGKILSLREAYGDYLVELGKKYPDIVVLDADLSESTKTGKFKKEFPERYRDVGISEPYMVLKSAGMSKEGLKPFASTFAMFLVKSTEQTLQSVAMDKRDVKLIGTHGGISVGQDGPSHQAINDIAVFRSIPGIYVLVPSDAVELINMMDFMANDENPTYVRITRNKLPIINDFNEYEFKLGEPVIMKEFGHGRKIALISYGETVHECLKASEDLEKDGMKPRVVNIPTLNPLKEEKILETAHESDILIFVEDHVRNGGMGEHLSRIILESDVKKPKYIHMGLDTFAESGSKENLYRKYRLDANAIEETLKENL